MGLSHSALLLVLPLLRGVRRYVRSRVIGKIGASGLGVMSFSKWGALSEGYLGITRGFHSLFWFPIKRLLKESISLNPET